MGSCSNTHKAQHRFVILTFSQPSKDDQKYIIKDLCCRMQLILSLPYHTSHHCQAPTRLLCWFLFFTWCKSCLSLFQQDVQLIWSLCLLLLVSRAPVHFSSSPQAVSCRRQLSPLAPLLPPGGISSSGWQDKQALTSQLTPCCQYYVKYKKDWDWVTAFL